LTIIRDCTRFRLRVVRFRGRRRPLESEFSETGDEQSSYLG
jgi:hypothetical protein